jgi:lipoate-protein ligase A
MRANAGVAVDSGLRTGPENLRLDRAQWRAAQAGRAPACRVRFHRYRPTVALGAFETAGHALRAEYCRRHGIDIVRRISGGGAVYLDPGQLCWTLTLSRRGIGREKNLPGWLELLGEAVAKGLRALGVDAAFAPPNDVEVNGRKIASGFLALSEAALLYQGSLLLDLDTETMMKALRVPTEKLSPDGVRSARGRFATLHDAGAPLDDAVIRQRLLAAWTEPLGMEFFSAGTVTGPDAAAEPAPAENWDAEAGSWHQAFTKTPGGVLHVRARLDPAGEVLERAEFAGNLHLSPPDLLSRLSSRLAGTARARLDARIEEFFSTDRYDMLALTPADLRRGLALALDRRAQQLWFGLGRAQANSLMVHAPQAGTVGGIMRAANVMLVPYCAKPAWCKWRHRDGCPECGRCEVGEAYRLAREHGMRVVTITNFEHLQRTLAALREAGTGAYVGMCCRNFYLKREYAFREAGMPALLLDITGSNCYELQQEDLAYAGRFEAEARLDLEVLRRVMARAGGAESRSVSVATRAEPAAGAVEQREGGGAERVAEHRAEVRGPVVVERIQQVLDVHPGRGVALDAEPAAEEQRVRILGAGGEAPEVIDRAADAHVGAARRGRLQAPALDAEIDPA